MISYVELKRSRLSKLNEEIAQAKADLNMMEAILSLSSQPGWLKYKEGIQNVMRHKADKMLILEIDDNGMDYLDRKRAELAAEVRLLKQMLVEPDKYAELAPAFRARIGEMEKEAATIESQVGRKENV